MGTAAPGVSKALPTFPAPSRLAISPNPTSPLKSPSVSERSATLWPATVFLAKASFKLLNGSTAACCDAVSVGLIIGAVSPRIPGGATGENASPALTTSAKPALALATSTPAVVAAFCASPRAAAVSPIAGLARSLAAPKAFPMPNPVSPDINPSFKSPVTAVVAKLEPMALAKAVLPAAAVKADPIAPVPRALPAAPKTELPNMLPSSGARKGKNASGCPVIGLVVSCPVGDRDAIPATSIGFM